MTKEKEKILAISKWVKGVMQNNDPSHDYTHIARVLAIASYLCRKSEGANLFLTECIALLHDIKDDKLESTVTDKQLAEFLQNLDISEEQIQFILQGVNSISFRKSPTLPSNTALEVKIVQDADRIDAIGAVGIARAFAFAGHKKKPLGPNGANNALQHFNDKLFLLFDLLNTPIAKEIAKKRADFLHLFYDEFINEMEEQKWND